MKTAIKRVFLIVLDSMGVGELPDAAEYGDVGSHTLRALCGAEGFSVPNMAKMGIFNIPDVGCGIPTEKPTGCFGKLAELSRGKDTTTGHWEIAGVISPNPMPTYPEGFPQGIIDELSRSTGRQILCNKPYSGTQVIHDYGREHIETGALIVYTSADSVLQIAAHEEVIPPEELYEICRTARKIMTGDHAVGRIIARPFVGEWPQYSRTSNRHDFSVEPSGTTLLDLMQQAGLDVIGVGKIGDIYAGRGLTESHRTVSNTDGMEKAAAIAERSFNGLCFVNLVDFDAVYGHRNDVEGYAAALGLVDSQLPPLMDKLTEEDVLIITADHGCDPSTESTDHSREYVPVLVWGKGLKQGVNLGVGATFADIGATVADCFGLEADQLAGTSFFDKIVE
ncbi:MAG: phosphopentomutase [Oscillospiraceae bacterium]|nr:phosphopentomutase [Oscillospiraceae bacterium]